MKDFEIRLEYFVKVLQNLTCIIYAEFAFCILQGSVAKCLRYGRLYCKNFVGNVVLFPVVKEFLKSVKILQSSHQGSAANFKGAVFLAHKVRHLSCASPNLVDTMGSSIPEESGSDVI